MALIDRLKEHFADLGTQTLEVPEWGEDGKPLVIYYTPLTLAEKQKLLTIGERDGFIARLADALVMKAMDAEGKKLFTIADKHALRHQTDPDVLARVVTAMMSSPTPDDMGKGSSRTETSG